MTDREIMQMALDALNNFDKGNHGMRWQVPVIKALRAALAQPEQDDGHCQACEGNYCTANDGCVARDNPPQREWQKLNAADMRELGISSKEKNT